MAMSFFIKTLVVQLTLGIIFYRIMLMLGAVTIAWDTSNIFMFSASTSFSAKSILSEQYIRGKRQVTKEHTWKALQKN